ncbi:MAG TPA: GAF domain-containing protein [Candidatus Aquilonibacter sp.]|jgi:hypothetical protein|nr:GAF domain-containing protein [Candidatus Aquilonibacter sp.]
MSRHKNTATVPQSDGADATSDLRLHAARKRLAESHGQEDTIEGVREIVANFLGSEEMGLFLVDRKTGALKNFWSFGADLDNYDLARTMGESGLHRVMRGECHITHAASPASSDSSAKVQAFVPIRVANTTVAVLAILRLLPQKAGFDTADMELCKLLSNEAAHSLFSSTGPVKKKAEGARFGK